MAVLLTLFLVPNVAQYLLSLCDTLTLLRMQCTCTAISLAIDHQFRARFNIEFFLSHRFIPSSEVHAFRQLQALTQAIIAGSNALQFFAELHIPKSALELYVDYRHAIRWCIFLQTKAGYTFTPGHRQKRTWEEAIMRRHWSPTNNSHIGATLVFTAKYDGRRESIKLLLLQPGVSCSEAILGSPSSTYNCKF